VPRRLDPGFEGRGADPVQQRHRRHVEGIDQGFAGRDRAVEDAVEILRLVVGEPSGRIIDLGVGRRQSVIEGEP